MIEKVIPDPDKGERSNNSNEPFDLVDKRETKIYHTDRQSVAAVWGGGM